MTEESVFILEVCPDFRGCTVHKQGVWDSQMCPIIISVLISLCPDHEQGFQCTTHTRHDKCTCSNVIMHVYITVYRTDNFGTKKRVYVRSPLSTSYIHVRVYMYMCRW